MTSDRDKVKLLLETLEAVRSWIDSMSFTYNFNADTVFEEIDKTLAKAKGTKT
jgi:hypothetical protein